MSDFAFSSRIPTPHFYRDSNGRPQSFKPDRCEVYNVHGLTSHRSVSDERTALIARTFLGVWLEGKIIGVGPAHPSVHTNPEASYGAPEAPFWEQFIIRWEEVGTIGAVHLFDDFVLEYPLSLVKDIERSRRSLGQPASPAPPPRGDEPDGVVPGQKTPPLRPPEARPDPFGHLLVGQPTLVAIQGDKLIPIAVRRPVATASGTAVPLPHPTDPIETTAKKLGKSKVKIQFIRWLAARPDRAATLEIVVTEFKNQSLDDRHRDRKLRSARRLAEHIRIALDDEDCPLRLTIAESAVRLFDATTRDETGASTGA
jgi:hypothetical protein